MLWVVGVVGGQKSRHIDLAGGRAREGGKDGGQLARTPGEVDAEVPSSDVGHPVRHLLQRQTSLLRQLRLLSACRVGIGYHAPGRGIRSITLHQF